MPLNPAVPTESRSLGDNVIATAETMLHDEYIDVIFEPSPLLGGAFGMSRMPGTPNAEKKYPFGKMQKYTRDGREAWLGAGYGSSSNTMAFSRGSTLTTGLDDVGTVQRCEYANYTDFSAISWIEARENRGPQQRLDLYKERNRMVLRSLSSRIEGDLWSANADTAGGTQDEVLGVQTLIATVVSSGTVWKLPRATYTFQRNNTTVVTGTTDFASVGLSSMRTMWTSCSGNGSYDTPTCIGTTTVLLNAYEAELEDAHRITSTSDADAGFRGARYKGVPMFSSDNCLSGAMYFFNLNHMAVMTPLGSEFETRFFGPGSFPNAEYEEGIRVMSRLNWGATRHDRQGVISGFTDS